MSLKISIIIPVYNRPTLVARCIESCICQTMSNSDYEIIIIDDCSTDNTIQVIETYSSRYPNLIKIIKLSENSGGASRPRNIGIDNAQGEYVFFMDSDDRMHPDLLHDGYAQAKAKNCDLIIVTFYTCFLSNLHDYMLFDSELSLSREDWNSFFVLPGHFFRREQISNLNLRFSENIHGIEDNLFTFAFMFRSIDLCWDIIRGKISKQYNGFVRGEPYYFQDKSRKHLDIGTITNHWTKGNAAIPIIEQTFAKIAENPKIADKIHLALCFLGNFNERGELPIAVSCRTISDARFSEFHEAICELIPNETDTLLPPSVALIVNAFRTNNKANLPDLVESHLAETFQTETNFANYICALKIISKHYLVIISVKDSACYGNFKPEYSKMLIPFGLEKLLYNNFWHSYIGIIDEGNIICEKVAIESLEFVGKLDDISLSITSQGYPSGNSSSIKINGKEYSLNRNGFNIVVCDKTSHSVLDAVNFDTRTYDLACFRDSRDN